jgi:hypothetical protein
VTSKRRTIGYAIVYAGVGVLIVALVVVLIQLRTLAGSNNRTIKLIEDCTTAGGNCYEESRKTTADVIRVLNEFTTYVVACADKPGTQTVARIRECALKEAGRNNPAGD